MTGHKVKIHPHTLTRIFSADCECGVKFQTGTFPSLQRKIAAHLYTSKNEVVG